MTIPSRMDKVREEIKRCIEEGKRLFNVDLSVVQVRYDLRGKTAGTAGARGFAGARSYFVRLNHQMINGEGFDHIVGSTISHEYAHIICYMRPELGRGHDYGWKSVHRKMGGTGKRTHNVDVHANLGCYIYTTDRGVTVEVGKTQHNKLQRGRVLYYTCKYGKGVFDRTSKWTYRAPGTPKPVVVAAPPVHVPPVQRHIPIAPVAPQQTWADITRTHTVVPLGGMSKAEQVRTWIREAKQRGEGQDWVIEKAKRILGMPSSQAYTYTTGNWNRA